MTTQSDLAALAERWCVQNSATGQGPAGNKARRQCAKELRELAARLPGDDTARLDYIERTFGGCSNQERYLPLRMIWGKGCNGRTLREACDKYMARDAATPTASPAAGIGEKL